MPNHYHLIGERLYPTEGGDAMAECKLRDGIEETPWEIVRTELAKAIRQIV
jgi:hypothetical protein